MRHKVICLDSASCPEKGAHVRVGNEIHHCKGGAGGCECKVCIDLFWGAICGDKTVQQYVGGAKDATQYRTAHLPNVLDLL